MRNVVVVDSDVMTLHTVVGLLRGYGGFLKIIPAASTKSALETLAKRTVDLVIGGMHMSEADTIDLLLRVSQGDPQVRMIAITNNASSRFRELIKQMPSVVHFDQPLDISLLPKRIFTELQIDYGGQLRGISLSAFLQVMELEGRSCTLQISAKGKTGIVHLDRGKPVAAKMGLLTGKAAVLHILTWQNVLIDIDYVPVEVPPEAFPNLMNLLLESGRMVDEKKSQGPNLRRHARYDCLVGVDYDISNWVYQCSMRDISEGGAYIETEQTVNVGQRLIITLSSPALERTCAIGGTVVRRDPAGIGVRFDDLTLQQNQIVRSLMESHCYPTEPAHEEESGG